MLNPLRQPWFQDWRDEQAGRGFVYLDCPTRTSQRGLRSFRVRGGSRWALEVFPSSLIWRKPITAAVLLKGKRIRRLGESHLVPWGRGSQELGQQTSFQMSPPFGALPAASEFPVQGTQLPCTAGRFFTVRATREAQGKSEGRFKMIWSLLYLLRRGGLAFIKVACLAGRNEWHTRGLSSPVNLYLVLIHSCTFCYVNPYLSGAKSGKMKERMWATGGEGPLSPSGFTRGEVDVMACHLHRVHIQSRHPARNVLQTLLLRISQGSS